MRPCSVCRHEAAEAINRELLAGAAFRNLSERFHLSVGALHRHKTQHLASLLARADEAAGQDILGAALDKLAAIEAEAVKLGRAAAKKGQYAVAGGLLVREATRLVELTARLRGLLSANSVQVGVAVNVASPEFQQAVEEASNARIKAWAAALPEPLRSQIVACARERNRTRLAAETRRIAAELDAREPAPIIAPVARAPNRQRGLSLLPGSAEPVDRVDGGNARAQVLRFAEACGWPHLVLRAGLVIAQAMGWRDFAATASEVDLGQALAALEAVAPPDGRTQER